MFLLISCMHEVFFVISSEFTPVQKYSTFISHCVTESCLNCFDLIVIEDLFDSSARITKIVCTIKEFRVSDKL